MDSWTEQYFACWSSGDPDAVIAWFTDDVEYEDVPTRTWARGIDEARAFVEDAYRKAAGAQYTVIRSITRHDEYVIEWVMRPMGLRGVSVGSLRDGRILTNRDYWSTC